MFTASRSKRDIAHSRVTCRLRAVRIRRVGVALLIGLVAGLVAAGLQVSRVAGPLMALEASAQDVALQARRSESYLQLPGSGQVAVTQDPRETIVLVSIDERTIGELGAYNGGYPRRVVADAVQHLLVAPPRTLGIDIGFFEPTSDDAVLADALDSARKAGTRVVLAGVGLTPETGGGETGY
jgi:CHASE2 domain-containing sensor protein